MTPVHVILPDRAVRAKLRRDGVEVTLTHEQWAMFDPMRQRPGCYVLMSAIKEATGIQSTQIISELRCRLQDKLAPIGLEIQNHNHDGYRVVLKPIAPVFEEVPTPVN